MATEAESRFIAASRAPQGAAQSEPWQPDPTSVREQLERILASSEFLGSDRTHRFLRYIVEETLAGRGERIKAFSVAIATFGRDDSFDPQTDPIVRIEAGRLRRNLERYYLVAGAADRVRIEIPKGTYVPEFAWFGIHRPDIAPAATKDAAPTLPQRDTSSPLTLRKVIRSPKAVLVVLMAVALVAGVATIVTTLGARRDSPTVEPILALPHPSVAVLQFDVAGTEQSVARLSTGMTNELVRELSRFSSVFVLGPQSVKRFGPAPDITVVGTEAGVDFVLSGSIQNAGDRIRLSVQLSDTDTGGIVWADTYYRDYSVGRVFDLEVEIARDIVLRIAQPQGAIALFDWKRTRGKAPENWEAYECILQADDLHRRVLPPARAPEIRACLNRVVENEPAYADGWLMLALVEIDAVRFAPLALLPSETLELAYAAAQRAVELAPDNGRAHMALMMVLFFQGQVEPALAAGQVALQLNPQDPDILGEVGLRHVVSGDLEAGIGLVEQATNRYQTVPLSFRVARSLGYLRKGLYQEASDALVGPGQPSNFVYWSVLAAVHGKAGKLDEARHAASELLELYPDFPRWAWTELEHRNLVPELATTMAEGWRAAGLEVPASPAGKTEP